MCWIRHCTHYFTGSIIRYDTKGPIIGMTRKDLTDDILFFQMSFLVVHFINFLFEYTFMYAMYFRSLMDSFDDRWSQCRFDLMIVLLHRH